MATATDTPSESAISNTQPVAGSPTQGVHQSSNSPTQSVHPSTGSPIQSMHPSSGSPTQSVHPSSGSPTQSVHPSTGSPSQSVHPSSGSPSVHPSSGSPIQSIEPASASPAQSFQPSAASPAHSVLLPSSGSADFLTSTPPAENTTGRPDHLVDTRVFHNTGNSCLMHAEPFPVTFAGFRVDVVNTAVLRVFNKSATSQRFHIVPPSSGLFGIHYTKVRYFVPGSTLKIRVTFTPKEQRYHEDRVLIHCEDEFNLKVPIQAYPSVTFAAFPRHIRLPTTEIGNRRVHKIPLLVDAAIPTGFRVVLVEPCSALSVSPTEGQLPAEDAHLTVTYAPSQYCTSTTTLQLFLNDCGLPPATCTVAGRCVPGLRRQRLVDAQQHQPVIRRRSQPVLPPSGALGPRYSLTFLAAADTEEWPPDLRAHGAVARFLLQKFAASVVVQQTFLGRTESALASAGREQERSFNRARLQRLTRLAERSEVRRGQRPLDQADRQAILDERSRLWREYQQRLNPVGNIVDGGGPPDVQYVNKRLLRNVADPPLWRPPTYDIYLNNPWPFRLAVMQRFACAARTVLIRCRAERRLHHLRLFIADKRAEEKLGKCSEDEDEIEDEAQEEGEDASE